MSYQPKSVFVIVYNNKFFCDNMKDDCWVSEFDNATTYSKSKIEIVMSVFRITDPKFYKQLTVQKVEL